MLETAATTDLQHATPTEWLEILTETFSRISQDPGCAPLLADIGHIHFQLRLEDRPQLSYWEEYLGDRIVPHLGSAETYAVVAETTFAAFVGTLLRRISIMEAAADEIWVLKGDTAALMRCANLLPYVMDAFSAAVTSRYSTFEGIPL